MAIVKFEKEELIEIGLPDEIYPDSRGKIIEDKIVDNSRWSVIHEVIFELDGKTYKTDYSVGATEQQDERPWEYEDVVECVEVEPTEVTRTIWTPIQ